MTDKRTLRSRPRPHQYPGPLSGPLIIAWDEDDNGPNNHIPTIIYGAHVKPGHDLLRDDPGVAENPDAVGWS